MVKTMRHSTKREEPAELIADLGGNDYIIEYADGTRCHAIFNVFTCLYYGDDLYRLDT